MLLGGSVVCSGSETSMLNMDVDLCPSHGPLWNLSATVRPANDTRDGQLKEEDNRAFGITTLFSYHVWELGVHLELGKPVISKIDRGAEGEARCQSFEPVSAELFPSCPKLRLLPDLNAQVKPSIQ